MHGRRRPGFMKTKLYLTKGEGLSFAAPKNGEVAGSMLPIRRIRCLIGTGRFRRRMETGRSGGRGWWRISGL